MYMENCTAAVEKDAPRDSCTRVRRNDAKNWMDAGNKKKKVTFRKMVCYVYRQPKLLQKSVRLFQSALIEE
jgi:hypothetical protein